jgi:hypothetical protein
MTEHLYTVTEFLECLMTGPDKNASSRGALRMSFETCAPMMPSVQMQSCWHLWNCSHCTGSFVRPQLEFAYYGTRFDVPTLGNIETIPRFSGPYCFMIGRRSMSPSPTIIDNVDDYGMIEKHKCSYVARLRLARGEKHSGVLLL